MKEPEIDIISPTSLTCEDFLRRDLGFDYKEEYNIEVDWDDAVVSELGGYVRIKCDCPYTIIFTSEGYFALEEYYFNANNEIKEKYSAYITQKGFDKSVTVADNAKIKIGHQGVFSTSFRAIMDFAKSTYKFPKGEKATTFPYTFMWLRYNAFSIDDLEYEYLDFINDERYPGGYMKNGYVSASDGINFIKYKYKYNPEDEGYTIHPKANYRKKGEMFPDKKLSDYVKEYQSVVSLKNEDIHIFDSIYNVASNIIRRIALHGEIIDNNEPCIPIYFNNDVRIVMCLNTAKCISSALACLDDNNGDITMKFYREDDYWDCIEAISLESHLGFALFKCAKFRSVIRKGIGLFANIGESTMVVPVINMGETKIQRTNFTYKIGDSFDRKGGGGSGTHDKIIGLSPRDINDFWFDTSVHTWNSWSGDESGFLSEDTITKEIKGKSARHIHTVRPLHSLFLEHFICHSSNQKDKVDIKVGDYVKVKYINSTYYGDRFCPNSNYIYQVNAIDDTGSWVYIGYSRVKGDYPISKIKVEKRNVEKYTLKDFPDYAKYHIGDFVVSQIDSSICGFVMMDIMQTDTQYGDENILLCNVDSNGNVTAQMYSKKEQYDLKLVKSDFTKEFKRNVNKVNWGTSIFFPF